METVSASITTLESAKHCLTFQFAFTAAHFHLKQFKHIRLNLRYKVFLIRYDCQIEVQMLQDDEQSVVRQKME